jgi:hypothetical protein
MSAGAGEPSEEELRAAWEEQLRRLTPADVIVQAVVSLISLAGRRLGVEPGTEAERDLEQVRDAIDGARGLMPVLERREDGQSLRSLREALSALQLEYVRATGAGAGAASPAAADAGAGGAGSGAEGGPGAADGGSGGSGGGDGGDGGAPAGAPASEDPAQQEGPGPAQRSGRLWIPGS